MLDLVIQQRKRSLGGFDVGRVLPFPKRPMVGPFVFFDHIGPVEFPRGVSRHVDVRPHPHIGLSTITYLFAGEIMHRDSLGSEQPIRPGEVNWMTAGRGITHSERFERARMEGGPVHGIQAWTALPAAQQETEPLFEHHGSSGLPIEHDAGKAIRLVAGEAFGMRARVVTHSPMFYMHVELQPGARAKLPSDYPERAAYIVAGSVEVDGRRYESGQMLVFSGPDDAVLTAGTSAVIMALGGEPLGPRIVEWNFVSTSKERIEQAKADWRAGRMKLPPLDHDEYIPLPEESSAPPNPMS